MESGMSLNILREQIIALEMGRNERRMLPLGLSVIDDALQGGLDIGAMHEFSGPAAALFAQLIVQRKQGNTFWLANERLNEEYYPPALAQYGSKAEQFIMLRLKNMQDLLSAAYEVLASNAAGCVLLEMQKPLNQIQARKLQIAVQNTNSLGLIINAGYARYRHMAHEGLLGSTVTRWHVEVLNWSQERTRLGLHLVKNRRGSPCHWIVEIDHATHHLHLATVSGERTGNPSQPQFVGQALCAHHA